MKYLEYLLASIILVLIDGLWLGYITTSLFEHQIKTIQNSQMRLNITAVILAYLFIVFGINYFIIRQNKTPLEAAFLGWIIYFTYDLTNKAIFDKYSWVTVLIDGLWGGVLFGSTTYITYQLTKLFKISNSR
jgi:uncharacterized membrane protein